MNSPSITQRKSSGLSRAYQAALGQYLKQGPAASLQPAARVGRQAVVLGLDALDLALMHEQALLARVLPSCSPGVRDRMLKRAGTFFAEAILPLEETHRSALEANAHLSRLNQTLNQRTVELVASNRGLRKEIAQRQAAEESLRNSQQHYRHLLERSRLMQGWGKHPIAPARHPRVLCPPQVGPPVAGAGA
jgi:PAS domain-containing protein